MDEPVGVDALRPEVQGLTGHHDSEPVALIRQREVTQQPETRPPGRQDRLAQLAVAETLDLVEDVAMLVTQSVEQQVSLG
ncbi:uncharacterized protein PD653_1773 [Nocardioides sp. PD653]|nr:uncharacterized protein PD653B2_1043 [Nocardioides sp. PD653-B2]GAW54365.1 uncharacterized protein PD653_1773 [Nocardioides sp. PD653]